MSNVNGCLRYTRFTKEYKIRPIFTKPTIRVKYRKHDKWFRVQ